MDPTDEGPHPAGAEAGWNESVLFTAYDAASDVGFRLHQTSAAGQTRWERLYLFLPGDRLGFSAVRFAVPRWGLDGAGFDGPGQRLRCEAPFERWSLHATVPLEVAPASSLFDGGSLSGHSLACSVDAMFTASAPAWYPDDRRVAGSSMGARHYEQHMVMSGTVTVGGEQLAVSGPAVRDHTWGPRETADWRGHTWLCARMPSGRATLIMSVLNPEPHVIAWGWEGAIGIHISQVIAPLLESQASVSDPVRVAFSANGRASAITASVLRGWPSTMVRPRGIEPGWPREADGDSSIVARALYQYVECEWDGERGVGFLERSRRAGLLDQS